MAKYQPGDAQRRWERKQIQKKLNGFPTRKQRLVKPTESPDYLTGDAMQRLTEIYTREFVRMQGLTSFEFNEFVEASPWVTNNMPEGFTYTVVYMNEDQDLIAVGVDGDTEQDAWTMVDYLVGEDMEPLTIVKGNEVIAYRKSLWLSGDVEIPEHWISGDPDNYTVPEEYREH